MMQSVVFPGDWDGILGSNRSLTGATRPRTSILLMRDIEILEQRDVVNCSQFIDGFCTIIRI